MIEWFAGVAAVLCAGQGLAALALPGLFLAGLSGSAVHCTAMCGPFVLGQVGEGLAQVPAKHLCEWHRLSNGLLLPYHLGRLSTYAALGALAGLSGSGLGFMSDTVHLTAILLGFAALLFLGLAVRLMLPNPWRESWPRLPLPARWRGLWRLASRVSGGRLVGRYIRGVLLGFLPCGMVYGALVAAAASAAPETGAVAMLAFGLGTVPALWAVGMTGQAMARRWSSAARRVAPMLLASNAVLLAILSWNLS